MFCLVTTALVCAALSDTCNEKEPLPTYRTRQPDNSAASHAYQSYTQYVTWPLNALKRISLLVIKNPLSLLYAFSQVSAAQTPPILAGKSGTLMQQQTFDKFFNTDLCSSWAIHDSPSMKRALKTSKDKFCKTYGCEARFGCAFQKYYRSTPVFESGIRVCDIQTCSKDVMLPCNRYEKLASLQQKLCKKLAPQLSQSLPYYNMRCFDEDGKNLRQNKDLNMCMDAFCKKHQLETCPPSPWWWPDSMMSYCDTVFCPSGKLKPETAEKAEKHQDKCYRKYCRNSPAHNKRTWWLKYDGGWG